MGSVHEHQQQQPEHTEHTGQVLSWYITMREAAKPAVAVAKRQSRNSTDVWGPGKLEASLCGACTRQLASPPSRPPQHSTAQHSTPTHLQRPHGFGLLQPLQLQSVLQLQLFCRCCFQFGRQTAQTGLGGCVLLNRCMQPLDNERTVLRAGTKTVIGVNQPLLSSSHKQIAKAGCQPSLWCAAS